MLNQLVCVVFFSITAIGSQQVGTGFASKSKAYSASKLIDSRREVKAKDTKVDLVKKSFKPRNEFPRDTFLMNAIDKRRLTEERVK